MESAAAAVMAMTMVAAVVMVMVGCDRRHHCHYHDLVEYYDANSFILRLLDPEFFGRYLLSAIIK